MDLRKMWAAEFRQWAESLLRYLPDGGTWWRGRYSHIRFLDRWFPVEIYVEPSSPDWFRIYAKAISLGKHVAIMDTLTEAAILQGVIAHPWRLIGAEEGELRKVPEMLWWDSACVPPMERCERECDGDPGAVFEDHVVWATHATPQEAKELYLHGAWYRLDPPVPYDLLPVRSRTLIALVEGVGGDLSKLYQIVEDLRFAAGSPEPGEASSDTAVQEKARLMELVDFVERGSFQREFEDIVGGWVQALQDELFTYDKPKPVLGASIPFEERSL